MSWLSLVYFFIWKVWFSSFRYTGKVGPWTLIRSSRTQDPGPKNFQVGLRSRNPWSGTLMNNLLAWKFECCNKSIDILLKLKLKTIKNSFSLNDPAKQSRLLKYCIMNLLILNEKNWWKISDCKQTIVVVIKS